MADFTTWARPTLERLATELQADNQRLRDENRTLLDAWRAEVCRNESTELNTTMEATHHERIHHPER